MNCFGKCYRSLTPLCTILDVTQHEQWSDKDTVAWILAIICISSSCPCRTDVIAWMVCFTWIG